jgi:hypothetical protein
MALSRIAFFQGRRDEEPNRELARQLAEGNDLAGIREIAANLWHEDPSVQSDCVKVLYEVGYLKPELIADYVGDFLRLIRSRHNRLVWGGILALSTIAHLRPNPIYQQRQQIVDAMSSGSVITVDNAVKALALVASRGEEYRPAIWPHLLRHLETCRPKDVPQHAESTLVAVGAGTADEFVDILTKRLVDLSSSQTARVKKVIREAQKRAAP